MRTHVSRFKHVCVCVCVCVRACVRACVKDAACLYVGWKCVCEHTHIHEQWTNVRCGTVSFSRSLCCGYECLYRPKLVVKLVVKLAVQRAMPMRKYLHTAWQMPIQTYIHTPSRGGQSVCTRPYCGACRTLSQIPICKLLCRYICVGICAVLCCKILCTYICIGVCICVQDSASNFKPQLNRAQRNKPPLLSISTRKLRPWAGEQRHTHDPRKNSGFNRARFGADVAASETVLSS